MFISLMFKIPDIISSVTTYQKLIEAAIEVRVTLIICFHAISIVNYGGVIYPLRGRQRE